MDIESGIKIEMVGDGLYCRLCFSVSPREFHELSNEISSQIQTLFHEIDLFEGSSTICEDCRETINNFTKYRKEILEKQSRFSNLIFDNQHNDFKKIQALSLASQHEDYDLDYKLVKVEPLELPLIDTIVSDTQSVLINVPKKIRKIRVLRNPAAKKKKKLCVECNKEFTDIIAHQVKFHDMQHLFECNLCSYSTYDLPSFRTHRKVNHKSKMYKDSGICPYCALVVKSSLEDHIANIHNGEKHFFCDLCDFAAYRKNSLEYHILHNHCSVKDFNCSQCNFSTVTKQRLRSHIKNMHVVLLPKFSCKYAECRKKFTKKLNLEYHIKRCHEGELKFPCEHPGKKIRERS